jgi:hypothetical protein
VIALASLQSSESKPHSRHRSTLTFLILPYWLGLSHLPGVVGQVRALWCPVEWGIKTGVDLSLSSGQRQDVGGIPSLARRRAGKRASGRDHQTTEFTHLPRIRDLPRHRQ